MSEFIKVSVREGVGIIEIDRKQKMNALNPTCYKAIGEALYQLDADPEVIIGMVSGGDGDWFSSGNDLSYFAEVKSSGQAIDLVQLAKDTSLMVERYVNAWIDFSKPLVAAVNGSAMGIAVTTLALCDVVFCTDIAEFTCPFSGLGQSPEGVSSLLFPRIMGISKASEVLLFGKTLTAQDALRYHLVSDVLPVEGFQAEIWKRVQVSSTNLCTSTPCHVT
jgi:peroxisomal 3,2-trans-enoyl-CoA isomerase